MELELDMMGFSARWFENLIENPIEFLMIQKICIINKFSQMKECPKFSMMNKKTLFALGGKAKAASIMENLSSF